jgi:hypothetical protein
MMLPLGGNLQLPISNPAHFVAFTRQQYLTYDTEGVGVGNHVMIPNFRLHLYIVPTGKGKKPAHISPDHIDREGGIPTESAKKARENMREVAFKPLSLDGIKAIFESINSLTIWITEVRPAMRLYMRQARMTLTSLGCPNPDEDLSMVLIVLEINTMNELTEAVTEFESRYSKVGGKGTAVGKNGLVHRYLTRVQAVADYVDNDRTIGTRKARRCSADLVIFLLKQRLRAILTTEVHGFDARSSLGTSRGDATDAPDASARDPAAQGDGTSAPVLQARPAAPKPLKQLFKKIRRQADTTGPEKWRAFINRLNGSLDEPSFRSGLDSIWAGMDRGSARAKLVAEWNKRCLAYKLALRLAFDDHKKKKVARPVLPKKDKFKGVRMPEDAKASHKPQGPEEDPQ